MGRNAPLHVYLLYTILICRTLIEHGKSSYKPWLTTCRSRFPDEDFIRAASVLDPTTWPADKDDQVMYGDCEVALLAKTIGMNVSDFYN